ncbi:hypothetical protein [Amycolatopsis palatopharyngis]|nr:hypothetical protein [Amycolatopsis palatopharyngis]
MSEWAWVVLGYGVAGVAVAGYFLGLARRWVRLRRRIGGRS